MKIKILGTAAAEGWPGLFCNCHTCQKVRRLGGKNIRSRSSVLIDETLMIDAGFDNFMHSLTDNADFTKIKDVFFTHEHTDHCVASDLYYNAFYADMNVYGNKGVMDRFMEYNNKPEEWSGINLLLPYETVVTGDGHTVTSVKAEHNPDQADQLNYVIQYKDRTVAYLTDTGLYKDEKTWDFLSRFKFDTVISECTMGIEVREPVYHQNYDGVKTARERFRNMGCIADDTPFYLTHFSHNMIMLHDEICEKTAGDGFIICYDGMDIDV